MSISTTIEKLEEINYSDEFAYEKTLFTLKEIENTPIIQDIIPCNNELFRSRPHNGNEDFFDCISDISVPPNKVVKNFARYNKPFQSKFYCSDNRPTSYFEFVNDWLENKKVGDTIKISIGRWKLLKPLNVLLVTSPDKCCRISEFDKKHGAIFDKQIEEFDQDCKDNTILLYRFLFEKFRSPAKNDVKTYIITSAFCNLVFAHTTEIGAVYYPSVPFNGQGKNLAINKNFIITKNIELLSVMRNEIRVTQNNGILSFEEIPSQIEATKIDFEKNTIKWV